MWLVTGNNFASVDYGISCMYVMLFNLLWWLQFLLFGSFRHCAHHLRFLRQIVMIFSSTSWSKGIIFLFFQLKNQYKENVESIRKNEQRASLTYSDLLTFLFENIAKEIETQQSLVDTYYGEYVICTCTVRVFWFLNIYIKVKYEFIIL